jgi:heme/copper-type cytochrome/quinol oxidase subunit 4
MEAGQHGFLVRGAAQLPHAQRAEHRDAARGQQHREHAGAPHAHHAARTVGPRRNAILGVSARGMPMSFTTLYKAVLVIVFLVVIFELGQALYFMMTDRKDTGRTVWALTRRVAFSVLLIALIVIGIVTGVLHPHGVYVR